MELVRSTQSPLVAWPWCLRGRPSSLVIYLHDEPAASIPWGTKIEFDGVMDLVTVDDAIAAFQRFVSDRHGARG